jgi:predicted nucleotidyltransferase
MTPATAVAVHPLDPLVSATLRQLLPGVESIYRHGSAGSAYERAESDIDLAVLGRQPFDFSLLLRAGAELSRLTGKAVDLNDMRRLPVTLRVQIVTGGVRLFAADPAAAEEYDSRVLSDYAHLNEARRGILDDIRARGSIHG